MSLSADLADQNNFFRHKLFFVSFLFFFKIYVRKKLKAYKSKGRRKKGKFRWHDKHHTCIYIVFNQIKIYKFPTLLQQQLYIRPNYYWILGTHVEGKWRFEMDIAPRDIIIFQLDRESWTLNKGKGKFKVFKL